MSVDNLLKRVWEKQGFCGQFSTKQFHTVFKGCPSHIHTAHQGKQADVRYTGRLVAIRFLIFDFFQKDIIFGNSFAYFVAGMHDRGVVTVAELVADLRKSHVQKISAQIHGDLPGSGYFLTAAIGFQIFDRDMIKAGNHIHDDAAVNFFTAHWLNNIL